MKGSKIWIRGLALILVLTMLIPNIKFSYEFQTETVATAAGIDDYALFHGSTDVSNGLLTFSESEISSKDLRIALKNGSDPGSSAKINILKWEIKNEQVVMKDPTATPDPDNRSIAIIPTGPGKTTVVLSFEVDGNKYPELVVDVKVMLNIDATIKPNYPVPDTRLLVMNTKDSKDKTYPFQYLLRSMNSKVGDLTHQDIHWTSSNPYVATITNGLVTSVGAGLTTITGTSTSDASITDKIDVLVLPIALDNGNDIDNLVMAAGKEIQTNAELAAFITWKFYDQMDLTKETDKFVLDVSTEDETAVLNNKTKAGKYIMKLYTGSSIDGNAISEGLIGTSLYPRTYKINVPIEFNNEVGTGDVKETTLVMSVGDIYDIEENSNIRSQEHFLARNDTDVPKNVIDSNTVTYKDGKITAVGVGKTTVELHMINNNTIYDQYYWRAGYTPLVHKVNIEIVDGIKLNMSQADLYVSGELQLTYTVASGSGPVTWVSNDPEVATVKSGLVTGVKAGKATITASYKDKYGVVKSATCLITVSDAISGIKITPDNLEISVAKSELVTAVVSPDNVTNTDLKWSSSDESIATVEQVDKSLKATITGVAAGTTVITAINKANVVVGYCKVTVTADITGIKLSENEKTVNLGDKTFRLVAELTPSGASNNEIVWESTDTKVASVVNGVVTLAAAGKTTIIASSKSNPNIKDFCNVVVNVSVTGLTLEATSKVMYVGEKAKVGYTVVPTNAANKNVVWTSTNPTVATVDANGNVTPIAVGQTVLIAKTVEGGYMQTCTIYVKQEAKTIQLSVKDITIDKGEDYKLEYTFDAEGVTEANLVWTSTNPTVATVNDKGVVSGLEKGSTIIMVKLPNGETAYCNVIVQEAVEGIELNSTKKTIYLGNTFTLKAALKPDGASNPSVTWSTSDKSIATVSAKGKVKGIKAGTAIISAVSDEGGYIASCVVTVEEYVTKVKLNKTSYKLAYKKTYTLKATVETKNTTNKKIQWTSSNPKVVSVSSSGKITGKKYGTATITAKALDGSGSKATCKVQVVRPVTKVKLNVSNITMLTGKTTKMKATITPSNATIKSVTWTSSDEKVAKVLSNGTVSALSAGTTIIRATAKDNSGKSSYCLVTVKDPVAASSISIMTQNPVLIAGESFTMERSVMPANNTDKVTWASDNTAVASIEKSTGRVKAKRAGIANVTAVTQSGKTSTTTVTVIGLNRTSLTLSQYENYSLYVEGMTTGITWDISNPAVAVITNGSISTRAPGTAVITATVKGRRLTCRLTVTEIR